MSGSVPKALIYLIGIISLFAFSACQSDPITPPQWQWQRAEAGLPRQAIMTTVAVNPLNSHQLWTGYYAAGGLATSDDGGQTWTTEANGLADNPVFDILPVVDVANGKEQITVWAAARDGLFVSDDGGQMWQPVSDGLPAVSVFALAADAVGRVYAGLDEDGVYVQTPDKTGWQALTDNEVLISVGVLSLVVSADGQTIYVGASGGGIFASRDGGKSWQNSYADKYIPNIAFNPHNPLQAVAALREETIADGVLAQKLENLSTQDYLIRTTDGGQTWYKLPLDWTNDEVTALLWLPNGTLGVGTGQGQLFKSADGGDTWQGGLFLPGGGILDLAVANESRLLAASWFGLYASDDSGQSWQNLAPSLGVLHAQTLLATDTDVLLGTQSGLYHWQPNSQRWQPLVENIPVTSLATTAEGHPLYMGTPGDGVYRSDDAARTWHKTPAPGVGVPQLAVNPQNDQHLVLLAAWERPYESLDGGQTWHARWQGLGNEVETVSLALDPLAPHTYVGTEAGLYLSRKGNIWQPVALNLLDESILALSAQTVPIIYWKDSVLYVGTTRGVYRSLDGGATVQGVDDDPGWGYGLEDVSVTAFLMHPTEPRLLYAGTAYNGVYQSVDGGGTWQPVGPVDGPEAVIEQMAWGPDGEIFFVTAEGVWLGQKESR